MLREEQGKQSPLLAATALKLAGQEMKSCLQTKARLLRDGEMGKKETISSISPASLWGEMGFLKGDVQLASTSRLLQQASVLCSFFSSMQPKTQMHGGGSWRVLELVAWKGHKVRPQLLALGLLPVTGPSAGGGSSSPSGFLLINTIRSHPCYFCGDSLFSLHPSPHCISWLHKRYHSSP